MENNICVYPTYYNVNNIIRHNENSCLLKHKTDNIRIKYCFDILTAAIVFLICSAAVSILVSAGISMYTAYNSVKMQEQAVQYATNNGHYLDVSFSDSSAIGINVTKGKGPTAIKNSKATALRVIVKPRNSTSEYYRTSSGSIITPYSLIATQ